MFVTCPVPAVLIATALVDLRVDSMIMTPSGNGWNPNPRAMRARDAALQPHRWTYSALSDGARRPVQAVLDGELLVQRGSGRRTARGRRRVQCAQQRLGPKSSAQDAGGLSGLRPPLRYFVRREEVSSAAWTERRERIEASPVGLTPTASTVAMIDARTSMHLEDRDGARARR